jgi:hypothetical protein
MGNWPRKLADLDDLVDATELEERLVPLRRLAMDSALPPEPELPTPWVGIFSKASAIADKDVGSVSGGLSHHLCIGSMVLPETIETGVERGLLNR